MIAMAPRKEKINWRRIVESTIEHLISVADNQGLDLEKTLARLISKCSAAAPGTSLPDATDARFVHKQELYKQELRLIRDSRLSLAAYGDELVRILAGSEQHEAGLQYLAAVIQVAYLIGLHCEATEGAKKRSFAKISRAARVPKITARAKRVEDAIRANPGAPNKTIAKLAGVSERTVRRQKKRPI
jgi:hypothetical protein